ASLAAGGPASLAAGGTEPRDPFFCIDSALSWLVDRDDVRQGLLRALHRSGVGMSRERLSWEDIHRRADRWDWEGSRQFDTLRRTHEKCGVEVLEMFHSTPAWLGLIGKYPDDLAKTARAWQQIGRRWQSTWGAMEVWNEPDIFFGGNLPADQYVPLVRTIAYALHRGEIDVPLLGGSFAHHNRAFLETAARNGMLDCVDAVSFHTYGRAQQMEKLVADYRTWLRRHDREAMPLWITECGRPWSRGPGRPPHDQDAVSALDITMKAVEARAAGVARYFCFVYPYYEERTNNFGMTGSMATPLRSMAAYVQLISAVGHKSYLGDLKCDDPNVQRARVFGDEHQTVAIVYTGRPDENARVKLPVTPLRLTGIDGRELEKADDETVPVPDGLTYVWLDRDGLADRLQTDVPAVRLWKIAQDEAAKPSAPSPIVLRFQWDDNAMRAESEGYHVLSETPGTTPLRVRVFNLDEKPCKVTLKTSFSQQMVRLAGSASQTHVVPAEGFADAVWLADLTGAFAATGRLQVTFTATNDRTETISPLWIDLAGEVKLADVLERYPRRVRLPIEQADRWQANIVGHGRMTITTTAEKHWRLKATFGDGDKWVYPFFRLPDEVDLRRATGLVLRGRCDGPATASLAAGGTVRLLLWEGDTGVAYLTSESILPGDGRWHTAVVRFADLAPSLANEPDANGRLDLDRVRKISIGLNSRVRDSTLEISEVHLVETD
ncbi:MAG: hypothetical protein HQ567_26305, partial [Candidatus Nealsonbacteria bacterium]|nr:hypothetical protein [Candidatus Nealsonbacteria bacterium]